MRNSTLTRKSRLTRRTPLARGTKLRPVSKRRREASKRYSERRRLYLAEHEKCEVCAEKTAVEIHHKCGRRGGNYTSVSTFMAVCRGCHDFIHQHPKWAEEVGYLSKNR